MKLPAPQSTLEIAARRQHRLNCGADFFVSDVHLSEDTPETSERFLRFLDLVSETGRRLYLLGDIFDYWVGRKQQGMTHVVPVVERVRRLGEAGLKVRYIAGNRDFNFDARVNGGPPPFRLPDFLDVESYGKRLLLTHGDLLCTRDRSYLRARRLTRSRPARSISDRLPLAVSLFLARGYRRLSERLVARKGCATTAMNFGTVREHLRSGFDYVVSGHAHKAARYELTLPGGRPGQFVVLGDWGREGVYAVSRGAGVELRRFV